MAARSVRAGLVSIAWANIAGALVSLLLGFAEPFGFFAWGGAGAAATLMAFDSYRWARARNHG